LRQKLIARTFIPGSEWIYFKIYSGTTTATILLTDVILPFTQELEKENSIQQWFFIRYGDPEPHIRVRFLCKEADKIGEIMSFFQKSIQVYVDQGLVWKIQMDTYQREIERYGANTMEVSEQLFHYDSQMIVEALHLIDDKELKLFFVLRAIDQLLEDFKLTTSSKLKLVQKNAIAFKNEFNADKKLRKQLDTKYRNYRASLESFLNMKGHEEYQPLINLINQKSDHIKTSIESIFEEQNNNTLEVPIESLVSSYIHMHINRFFDYYRSVIGKLAKK